MAGSGAARAPIPRHATPGRDGCGGVAVGTAPSGQWIRRTKPQMWQRAVPVSGSTSRKLVQPLVLQKRRLAAVAAWRSPAHAAHGGGSSGDGRRGGTGHHGGACLCFLARRHRVMGDRLRGRGVSARRERGLGARTGARATGPGAWCCGARTGVRRGRDWLLTVEYRPARIARFRQLDSTSRRPMRHDRGPSATRFRPHAATLRSLHRRLVDSSTVRASDCRRSGPTDDVRPRRGVPRTPSWIAYRRWLCVRGLVRSIARPEARPRRVDPGTRAAGRRLGDERRGRHHADDAVPGRRRRPGRQPQLRHLGHDRRRPVGSTSRSAASPKAGPRSCAAAASRSTASRPTARRPRPRSPST